MTFSLQTRAHDVRRAEIRCSLTWVLQNGTLTHSRHANTFTLKEYEGEDQLTLTSGVTELIGNGLDSRFRTMIDFDKVAIDNALSSYEGDVRTGFLGLGEWWSYSTGT